MFLISNLAQPMYRKLPPISLLRTFEAAARCCGFSTAAKELYVTHSAVSQQIRTLERQVGYSLFYRSGNAMLLTEPGKRLLEQVRQILLQMESVFPCEPTRDATEDKTLIIEVMAPIAEKWLIPRLKRFHELNPDILLNIRIAPDLVALDDGIADVYLRYGDGNWPGIEKIKLCDEQVFPACSPAFIAEHPEISLDNLKQHPLLRHSLIPWGHWFEKAGLSAADPENALTFNDVAHAINAALTGQGIVLARHLLVREHLRNGGLVKLFDIAAPGTYSYYLGWKSNQAREGLVARFRKWVISELADDDWRVPDIAAIGRRNEPRKRVGPIAPAYQPSLYFFSPP
jgi:LysR family glycine cleavage system transcriptional activator